MTRALRTAVTIGILCAAGGRVPAQTSLSADEKKLAAFVDANNGDALAMLERAVNINSGSMNFEGVRQVGALFRKEFDALGFKTDWIDGASWNRAGHLIATHPAAGPKILLIGHLDT